MQCDLLQVQAKYVSPV